MFLNKSLEIFNNTNSSNNSNSDEDNPEESYKTFGAVLLVLGLFFIALFLSIYAKEDSFKWNIGNILIFSLLVFMVIVGIVLLILGSIN